MKKLLFALTFLMLGSLLAIGQSTKHISLDFNPDDFILQQDEDGNYFVSSTAHNVFYKTDTLQPALPYIGVNVYIQETEAYISHTCSTSRSLVRTNATMVHNPKVLPTNVLPFKQSKSKVASFSQGNYPAIGVEFVGTNEGNGFKLLTFHVSPFEYNATTKRIYLNSHINIDISLNSSSLVSSANSLKHNKDDLLNIIKTIVVNPEDVEKRYPSPKRTGANVNLTLQTGYEYVIVTSNQFKDAFQELANWKSRKGIRAKVIATEDCVSNYSGSTRAEKVKRALADIDGLSYVLLGGDTLNVPTCMGFIGYVSGDDYVTPTDAYYSCIGTMNWDSNENGFEGEISDVFSKIPVLNVSRAPVSTVEDAQAFVNRIINYESCPDTTGWEDNILMCGVSLGNENNNVWSPYYVDGQSDTQIWSEMIYNQYIAPSDSNLPHWNGELTRFYDTFTDISGDGNYQLDYSNLQNELAKGYTFVDVMTHGTNTFWELEGSAYLYSDARNLRNSGYSIITTIACNTNAFDYHFNNEKCLSYYLLNNPQSGILAYWGTARKNWYMPYYTASLILGASFDALTYRKLFEDKYHRMGKATTEVKAEKMSHMLDNYYSHERKIWMGLNLMGDPEMPVYLARPKTFQNPNVEFVNDSIYVDAGTNDFDICFINQNDSMDYYIARDVADSLQIFSRLNGEFDVSITKPGYIPYTAVCGDTTYFQNIVSSSSKVYDTKNAIIGSNVTNRVGQGPVVIDSGSTLIKASQGVVITQDFEVKLGAEFAITNQ